MNNYNTPNHCAALLATLYADPDIKRKAEKHLAGLPTDIQNDVQRAIFSYSPADGLSSPASEKDDGWQAYTLADAYQPRPPIEYVIQTILPRASLSCVYGAPGSLKSMILADMAVCVASGQMWLKALPGEAFTGFKTTQAPVMWIDFDNGKRRTDERFDALGKSRSLPDTTPLTYFSIPSPWLDASNQDAIADLEGAGALEAFSARIKYASLPAIDGAKDITDYWRTGADLGEWIALTVERLEIPVSPISDSARPVQLSLFGGVP